MITLELLKHICFPLLFLIHFFQMLLSDPQILLIPLRNLLLLTDRLLILKVLYFL